MTISGVNSSVHYGTIASGKRINKAADDASGLAIAEKLKTEGNGYDVGASNAKDAVGVANIADGALGTVQDSLQRIRELSVQAKNTAVYTPGDISAMQDEVNQLLEDIDRTASGTQYNTMNLLDGSKGSMDMATSPDGSGMSMKMPNSTLDALGIRGYDLTGSFDINVIDKAIDKVSAGRSSLGASTNALESAYNYNRNASQQLTGARSRIEDLDIPRAVSDEKKNKLLEDYRNIMLKRRMSDDAMVLGLLR